MRRQISVLLVEDDEDDQIMTQALLSEIDEPECVLTWARTFEEGLQRLTDGPFDVCLLDYALGERTGMELLSRALAAGVEVPIIFLTGQAERALDVEATRLGAADYLVKGRIHADQLERSFRYAMERARALSTLRELNRELELTRNQALLANRARGDFLAAMSHTYRDALGNIVACNDALDIHLAGRDEVATAYVREIHESGQSLLSLLADVLDMSGREVQPPAVELRRMAIGPFVREIAAALRPLVEHNDNTFELTCPEHVGSLETDPAHLRRVLLNLLGNTCKFTRRGRIHLTVSRRPARLGDLDAGASSDPIEGVDCVELAIRPSGLWMTPAQLELLFASMPQAEAGEAPRGEGTESGIATSRRVCRLLGGELFVETEGSRRPVLRICVPDRRSPDSPDTEPPAAIQGAQ